jgi:arylsulfatase A
LSIVLPEQAGQDGVSFLPLLKPESMHRPVRDCMVHHSMQGDFALRKDNWVFIDAPTGEDVVVDPNCCSIVDPEPEWFKRERGYEAHAYPGELYNLTEDIRQRRNLYGEYPDKVREMRDRLEMIKGDSADAGTCPWGAGVSE